MFYFEVDGIRGTATYDPGHPGRYYGPMEDCEPEDPPEVTLETIEVWDDDTECWVVVDDVSDYNYQLIFKQVEEKWRKSNTSVSRRW